VLNAFKDSEIVTCYIHADSELLPNKYPDISRDGPYQLHIVKHEESLFIINLERKDREKLDEFYKLKTIHKNKIVLG
jgi:hypothetical protein